MECTECTSTFEPVEAEPVCPSCVWDAHEAETLRGEAEVA